MSKPCWRARVGLAACPAPSPCQPTPTPMLRIHHDAAACAAALFDAVADLGPPAGRGMMRLAREAIQEDIDVRRRLGNEVYERLPAAVSKDALYSGMATSQTIAQAVFKAACEAMADWKHAGPECSRPLLGAVVRAVGECGRGCVGRIAYQLLADRGLAPQGHRPDAADQYDARRLVTLAWERLEQEADDCH